MTFTSLPHDLINCHKLNRTHEERPPTISNDYSAIRVPARPEKLFVQDTHSPLRPVRQHRNAID